MGDLNSVHNESCQNYNAEQTARLEQYNYPVGPLPKIACETLASEEDNYKLLTDEIKYSVWAAKAVDHIAYKPADNADGPRIVRGSRAVALHLGLSDHAAVVSTIVFQQPRNRQAVLNGVHGALARTAAVDEMRTKKQRKTQEWKAGRSIGADRAVTKQRVDKE